MPFRTRRDFLLGATARKTSRCGRRVIERESIAGTVIDGEFKSKRDGNWYPLRDADMSHTHDCVRMWNEVGRPAGWEPRGPEARAFMNDPSNYYLEHYSYNRSDGAKLRIGYKMTAKQNRMFQKQKQSKRTIQ